MLDAPPHLVAELLGGVLYTSPRPPFRHAAAAAVAAVLGMDLGGAFPDVIYGELAPDWACEVLSPSTAVIDRQHKLPIYARERVGHVWLVDPSARTLEVHRLDAGGYRIVATHQRRRDREDRAVRSD